MDRRERLDDPEETLRAALDGHQASLWTAMPAVIQSFDSAAMTVVAQPTIQGQRRMPDGSTTPVVMPLCVDVPVIFPSGGGFTLTFPIAQGDECLLVFASRCIDAWWQLGDVQPALDLRMHDLSDGFALVGPRSQPRVIPSINLTSTQLRSDNGQTYVEVGTAEVTLTPDAGATLFNVIPGKITLVADVIVTHARNKNCWDAGGTGFVYTPGQIDTYTNGVPSTGHAPSPPEVPT